MLRGTLFLIENVFFFFLFSTQIQLYWNLSEWVVSQGKIVLSKMFLCSINYSKKKKMKKKRKYFCIFKMERASRV